MFAWLESTQIAQWVGLSLWGYPMLLSMHVIGLAIVVGLFSMRDLRLLGVVGGLEPTAYLSLNKLAWTGFTINAISGCFLFTSQAMTFISSIPFLLKISCVVAGMLLAVVIQGKLQRELAEADYGQPLGNSMKLLALGSLCVWIGAIVAGRLSAYL